MKEALMKTIEISKNDLAFSFLPSGDIFQVMHQETMINQLQSNVIDGSLNNIYLRIHSENGIEVFPLIGVQSNSRLFRNDSQLRWEGKAKDLNYSVTFHLSKLNVWFWEVTLDSDTKYEVDLIYGQDIGLADKAAVQSNEAYVSQYLDHAVFTDEEKGFVVCTKQNQSQNSGYPYLQQGMISGGVGYSTDGFQFYGKSYKSTNIPQALYQKHLDNEIYQYEFAYTALQSKRTELKGQQHFVFYGLFHPNHPETVSHLEFDKEVMEAWRQVKPFTKGEKLEDIKIKPNIGEPITGKDITLEELSAYYPNQQLPEYEQDQLLSFFTPTYEHVVLKSKEELVERPHGHILLSGKNDEVRDDTVATTSYMYGVFNSHLVIGNSNFHKFLSSNRNALNVMKASGQRIYIELDGDYRLLTMPSLFEIGFNYTRWYYKLNEDTIIVTNFTSLGSKTVQLQVESQANIAYRYLVTNQIIMNDHPYPTNVYMDKEDNVLKFKASDEALSKQVYPELSYSLLIEGAEYVQENESLLVDNVSEDDAFMVVLSISKTSNWSMLIHADLQEKKTITTKLASFAEEAKKYRSYLNEMVGGFNLTLPQQESTDLAKLNMITRWYTHNMLVHFSSPHGLEQYMGAAWGTRDVSQGPFEYFMATQNYETVRTIIKIVFSHQYKQTGNWPQWFMFDKYSFIQQAQSHGDIIVWPLKMIGDYLEATNDYTLLEEKVPYTDDATFQFTTETETIFDHIEKEIAYINKHFLYNTYLSAYDDGDWDDTLQPANEQFRQYMVSAWTVALTYQVIQKLAVVYDNVYVNKAKEMRELAESIKRDFHRYFLNQPIIPGFIYMRDPQSVELMLHPSDEKTGIDYRLLPMQRSMISGLFTLEQANYHLAIIEKHLQFPDGVRLMNRPATYRGGVTHHFKRAEQAANFGREIGLQYVHAHIRFVEAMAKLGYKEEAWNGLIVINPIGIRSTVPNADYRQSNAYFSSSDGKFATRYEAQDRFTELATGAIPVKGGWRIYSSGPGIYINQLISNVMGIRQHSNNLVIDPVIPESFNGLEFDFQFNKWPIRFVYHLEEADRKVLLNGIELETEEEVNQYRQGGFIIKRAILEERLRNQINQIDIYL
ncbi:GH36-type glycosyl hydrolase domain-containing protein [Paraliobacillus ryukyuensis]|uniref:GH36-type glycosyl hydrolase domain-containing protein n=1 Tax=Paraliobacillus ryukyuensis TaxID=200904 RepID=UPI0009A789AD|nr:cellobiose phosphorylase [Paraliobacillus ryukyuensis]